MQGEAVPDKPRMPCPGLGLYLQASGSSQDPGQRSDWGQQGGRLVGSGPGMQGGALARGEGRAAAELQEVEMDLTSGSVGFRG